MTLALLYLAIPIRRLETASDHLEWESDIASAPHQAAPIRTLSIQATLANWAIQRSDCSLGEEEGSDPILGSHPPCFDLRTTARHHQLAEESTMGTGPSDPQVKLGCFGRTRTRSTHHADQLGPRK